MKEFHGYEDRSFILDTNYLSLDLLYRKVSPEVFRQIVIGLKHLEEADRLMKTQRPEDAEVFSISCPELHYLVKKEKKEEVEKDGNNES